MFLPRAGAHHQEPATLPYSCHGVFTDRSIFSLNLSRIRIPTGTSVTNCNHKHGLMLTCRHVHVRLYCFILTEACSCTLELAYFAGKIGKNRPVCKNAVALAYYGSCRLLVKVAPQKKYKPRLNSQLKNQVNIITRVICLEAK